LNHSSGMNPNLRKVGMVMTLAFRQDGSKKPK